MSDSRSRRFRRYHLWLLVLIGCAGTETDDPSIDFRSSACKSKELTGAALSVDEATTADPRGQLGGGEAYDGLNCFAWTAARDGRLRVDIYNFTGSCGEGLDGRAVLDDSTLALFASPKGCAVASCGSCQYDLSFELGGVRVDQPLPVTLQFEYCGNTPREARGAVTLPLDRRASGVICRTGACHHGIGHFCGKLHCPPCADKDGGFHNSCGSADDPGCPADLVCDERTSTKACLAKCTSDSDCLVEVERCDGGACRLRETFE
jgi:hypothetical protein